MTRAAFIALVGILVAGCWDWDARTPNLFANPGCESDTEGWQAYHGVPSRTTAVSRTGTAACEGTASSDAPHTLDATVDGVIPVKGEVYETSLFARSDNAVGRPAVLTMREWRDDVVIHSTQSEEIELSTQWQQLRVTLTIEHDDSEYIDFVAGQPIATAGESFQVDDAILVRVSAP